MARQDVAAFLDAALAKFVNPCYLPRLDSIHTVLEEGEYSVARVASYMEQELLEVAAVAQDSLERLWGAFWLRKAAPQVLVVKRIEPSSILVVRGGSGGAPGM